MSFTPFLQIKSSSVVSVWYVASFLQLAFSATIITLFSRPSHLQMLYSQELLYSFLYVSYLGLLDWFLLTSVTTISQSRISTSATRPSSSFFSLSNHSSGDSRSIQRFHLQSR